MTAGSAGRAWSTQAVIDLPGVQLEVADEVRYSPNVRLRTVSTHLDEHIDIVLDLAAVRQLSHVLSNHLHYLSLTRD